MQGGRGRARNLHDHQIGLASSRNESDCGSLAVTGGNILPGHIMATDDGLLFTPVSIGKLTLPGRLIKTATAETRASDDGFVTPELIDFYRRSEEHTSELQSLMRISYAVFCLKKKKQTKNDDTDRRHA